MTSAKIRLIVIVLSIIVALGPSPSSQAGELDPAQERALLNVRDGQEGVWPGLLGDQLQELQEKAEIHALQYQASHEPHGYTVNLRWEDRTRAHLLYYDGLGDGAIWTGHYLAALAMEYAAERSPDTLVLIDETLSSLDLLTRVSGKEGFVARYLGPASDPYYQPYYAEYGGTPTPDRPGYGRRAFPGAPPHEHLVWLGASNRDTYDGIHFGCAAVWRYVDDSAIRDKVRTLVNRVGSALAHDWFLILDGRGNFELPNPSFANAWLRLMLSVSPDTFRNLRPFYGFSAWLFFAVDRFLGPGLRQVDERSYYPNNLDMARMFTLCTLEEDPRRRAAYQAMLRRNYRDYLATHLNAHFAAIYMLCTGDRDRGAIATLQGGLVEFPADKFTHIPEPTGALEGEEFSNAALLVRQRPMSDLIWQRAPARLPGANPSAVEYPALDYLLPYWMGRVAGVIPAR